MQHILLVGAGNMGSMHARCYTQMSNVNLVGIVDIRSEVVKELADTHSTRAFGSYEEASAWHKKCDEA
ncbi:MAG: putative oxidoreductase [Paenibacillus sp.]|nr:putative oxidoreductase [Paenibacillus sp.]